MYVLYISIQSVGWEKSLHPLSLKRSILIARAGLYFENKIITNLLNIKYKLYFIRYKNYIFTPVAELY